MDRTPKRGPAVRPAASPAVMSVPALLFTTCLPNTSTYPVVIPSR